MNTEQARSSLRKLKNRYLLLRSIEIGLFSVSAALVGFAFADLLSLNSIVKIFLLLLSIVAVAVALYRHYRLHQLSNSFFASYLNQRFLQLNASADLLLVNDQELSLLQQIQKEKNLQQLEQILPGVKLPHRILHSFIVFVTCSGLYFAFSSLNPLTLGKAGSFEKERGHINTSSPIFIKSFTSFITPPSYTKLKSFESNELNMTLPENSDVKWMVELSEEPADVKMFFLGRDSANLIKNNSLKYSLEKRFHESGFYQIQWKAHGKVYRSDFYKIECVKDQSPKIIIKDLNQFTKLKYTDRLEIPVNSELTDDYGLIGAQIVATVSKGSGEGVKFREEKLQFAAPIQITGKKIEASRILNLKKLGLEPADELYFYVEAWDNKTPMSNHSRTETFFIAIQDTASEITSVDAGLGVDLLPEYFRSQRQIIIDTEKLLRDKKNIAVQQFKFTSNELGFDQKALRLRYGQFLGDEDEPGIGQPVEESEEEDEALKKVTHQHDTKNEHNLVEQKTKQHQHADTEKGQEEDDPLKQFVHQHDNTEEATFFIQSLKSKLKAAITQMWDAELYLRLYQPDKSLPYQYNALNLLKEISSDSRIFVHRSGFDPPPLKEEKRLTADLSEVKGGSDLFRVRKEEKLQAVREALHVVEKMLAANSTTISKANQRTFDEAGRELAALTVEQPIIFLKGLSLLKSLSENPSKISIENLSQLRGILWKALPSQMASPAQQQRSEHTLNELFLKNLDQHQHE